MSYFFLLPKCSPSRPSFLFFGNQCVTFRAAERRRRSRECGTASHTRREPAREVILMSTMCSKSTPPILTCVNLEMCRMRIIFNYNETPGPRITSIETFLPLAKRARTPTEISTQIPRAWRRSRRDLAIMIYVKRFVFLPEQYFQKAKKKCLFKNSAASCFLFYF